MEQWDTYDVDRQLLSETMVRGNKQTPEHYRLVIGVCLFNEHGQMLIQKRTKIKQSWPNMWDISVSGSVISGESSWLGAKREIKEELGLIFRETTRQPNLSVSFNGGYEDYYLIETTGIKLEDLSLQDEEVVAVKWASKDDIYDMIKRNEFIPYHEHLIGLFFEMKESVGSYKREG